MVNKKKKSRQPGPDEQNASDSTESCEESQAEAAGAKCPHVQRAVDLNRVKKSLKLTGIMRKCGDCERAPLLPEGEAEEVKPEDGETPKESGGLWLCLRCGHQACGRDVRSHAQGHFAVPRSDCHALSLGAELRRVWCYSCSAEVPVAAKKKLLECVEFVTRQEDAPQSVSPPTTVLLPTRDSPRGGKEEGVRSASNAIVPPSGPDSPLKDLPRLRGLRNNGNTCFFNSVLQCLAHTPFLLEVLTETRESGESFSLPGRPDDEDDPLPPISGTLPGWGVLTETLASTLSGLRTGAADALNPSPLMDKLSARCPLFEGGDQHDAQELLRHLLEGVRAEDLKRYQTGILGQVGLSGRTDPEAVPEDVKARVKLYGRQAAELRLRPDHVFRGTLVSTLECQDCMHASQRPETFLDLSLPITADKPQPPVVTRRKSEESVAAVSVSKHQLKREKKAARKSAKAGRGHTARQGAAAAADGAETILEEKQSSNSAESEPSDADVEDNLDGDAVPAESGYSSAKAGDSPPLPASPPLLGDSALASPANAVPEPQLGEEEFAVHGPQMASGDNRRSLEVSGSDEVLFERAASPGGVAAQVLSAAALGMQLASLRNQAISDYRVSPASSEADLGDVGLAGDDADATLEEDRPVSRFAFVAVTPSSARTRELSPDGPRDPLSMSISGEEVHELAGLNDPVLFTTVTEEEANDYAGLRDPGQFNSITEKEVNDLINGLSSQTLAVTEDLPPLKDIDELLALPLDLADTKHLPTPCVDTCPPKLNGATIVGPKADWEASIEAQTNQVEVEDLEFGAVGGAIVMGWSESAPPPPAMPSHLLTPGRLPTTLDLKRPASPESPGQSPGGRWGGTLAAKLTTQDGECSVMSCLNQFTAVELMTGNNRVGCEACTKRQNHGAEGKLVTTNSTKQFLVAAPPPVLILHLKRFQLQRSMLRKMALHVAFPPLLDLASLISSQDTVGGAAAPDGSRRVLYALYGVVEHSGAMQYGHYVAYVKVRAPVPPSHPRWAFLAEGGHATRTDPAAAKPPPGKWFYVSDSRVNEVSEERVLHAEAYLLFYERIC